MPITENAIFAVYRGVTGFQQAARSNPLQVGKFHINQALANDDRQKKSRHKVICVGIRVGRRD